jgi:signal transduction histidine kinase/CheY-like chemotaxis protein
MRFDERIHKRWSAIARGAWLHATHEPRPDVPVTAQDEIRQRLRLHRFLLASTFSMLYVLVLGIYYTQGQIDRETLLAAFAIVAVAIVAYYALFHYRLNLRFRDPSLTVPQVTTAVCTMLLVVYRAPETRAVFTAFFFVALMFGMLRASARQLAVMGSLSLAGFAAVTLLRYATLCDAAMLRLDMLQLGVTAITFPWLVFIGGRVKQLKEADRRKDNFLATLAHELRNPLAPIRTGVQILRKVETGPRAQDVLPMIERQLQHLTRLLDDLLDVSRINHGKISLHLECVDLRDCVHAAVEASRGQIEQMRHRFALSMPAQPIWVDADPVRLAQVLSNLLNNAAKYTPAGGHVALETTQRDGMAEIAVSDNGVGIPAERLSTVFDMFTQLEGTAPHSQAGLGIGLSLVKGLVGLHKGSIEVRSQGAGQGSEFRIRLPMAEVRPRAVVSALRSDARATKLRVLVVDDSRDAASSLSTLVELMGHDVRTEYDGEAATRCAEDFRPQIVLLDIGMPGVDGYEACRRIRQKPWSEGMRFVAVTGWGQEEDRRRSAAAGFDDHLVKPVDPELLEDLLGDVRAPARA